MDHNNNNTQGAGQRRQFLKWAALAPPCALAATWAVQADALSDGPAPVLDRITEFKALVARSSAEIARIESFSLSPRDMRGHSESAP